EILCDHNDGHAPLCPRYILPDYERFMERGCDFLRLPAPRTLAEALASLTIFYTHVHIWPLLLCEIKIRKS
ncbi:glycyl radical enzyme domain-containing protein, partial [Anaerotruncus colihominis]|uniref:glycyl radical enzyme domain-containing protein n=1 Tax=Anaerotruncus colihominis TaxID=169435 RepID=UPI00210E0A0D